MTVRVLLPSEHNALYFLFPFQMYVQLILCGIHIVSAEAATAQTHNAPLRCSRAANSVIISDFVSY